MIIILYVSLGVYLQFASYNPSACKPLLSWAAWGANFCHGVIAFLAVFTGQDYESVQLAHLGGTYNATGDGKWSGGLGPNWDKLFVAVPLWFTLFAVNLFFFKKCWGSYLLPWDPIVMGGPAGTNVVPSAASDKA